MHICAYKVRSSGTRSFKARSSKSCPLYIVKSYSVIYNDGLPVS